MNNNQLKIIHTADWHLGNSLHDIDRSYEYRVFLDWLLETLQSEAADALLVAGDVFDKFNPSAEAQELWYSFLADCHAKMPALQIVMVGGNHDSAARLNAAGPILSKLKMQIVGAFPSVDGKFISSELCFAVSNQDSSHRAWIGAVPFVRSGDLEFWQDSANSDDNAQNQLARAYAEVATEISARKNENDAVIMTGHLYASGGQVAEENQSERKIVCGTLETVDSSVFGNIADYVALGHLHLPQRVQKNDLIRYSGAPLAMAFSENRYQHQILAVTFSKGEKQPQIVPILIPKNKKRQLIRILLAADQVEELFLQLKDLPAYPFEKGFEPLLDIRLPLIAPRPALRQEIEECIKNKNILIAQITTPSAVEIFSGQSEFNSSSQLANPQAVFNIRWQETHDGKPASSEILQAFQEILSAAQNGLAN